MDRLLLRMAGWARNPPPARRVVFFLGVLAICLAVAALNWAGWWPEALTLQKTRPPRVQVTP
jgi:hypothetical protein